MLLPRFGIKISILTMVRKQAVTVSINQIFFKFAPYNLKECTIRITHICYRMRFLSHVTLCNNYRIMRQNLSCTILYILYFGIEFFTQTIKNNSGFKFNSNTEIKTNSEVAIMLERNDLLHGDLLFKF